MLLTYKIVVSEIRKCLQPCDHAYRYLDHFMFLGKVTQNIRSYMDMDLVSNLLKSVQKNKVVHMW